MKVADFNYQLPAHLIAQTPPKDRTDSRLLKVSADGKNSSDAAFGDGAISDMLDLLNEGDLLVLNNTKVIPARLYGQKDTGGRIEVLLERVTGEHEFLAQIKASKSPKINQTLLIDGDDQARLIVTGRQDSFFELRAEQVDNLFAWFEKVGHMPLPPYIDRQDTQADAERYQTVFGSQLGAVAAPTAGLHYSQELLSALENKGVNIHTITLHVGAGTYQPVRVDSIADHQMHSEYIEVNAEVCDAIKASKANGKRVVAVGTTVVRSLETAAQACDDDLIAPYTGDTSIFIYPGFEFKVIDALQTNFHLPESTLLMLVSAFAGYDKIMAAYQHAIEKEYRFFSYGDAMFLEHQS